MLLADVWFVEPHSGRFVFVTALLLRITLLLALAWAAHWALARWSPYLRVYLWRAVVVGTIAVMGVALLPYRLSILPPASPNATETTVNVTPPRVIPNTASSSTAAPARSATDSTPTANATTTPLQDDTNWHSEPLEATSPTTAETSPSPAPPAPEFHFSVWLATAWATGALISIGSWLLGTWRLHRLYGKSTPVPPEVEEEIRRIANSYGYRGRIPVRQSERISTAISIGGPRPRILVATDQIANADPLELRATLAHEVAHAAGNDLVWNHLVVLLRAVFWFHPLMWPVRLAHVDACDEVCDARAAAYLGDSKLYGRLLAQLALKLAGFRTAAGLAFARRSQVRRRVEVVAENALRIRPARPKAALLLGGVMLASLMLGLLTTERAPAQAPATKQTAEQNSLTGTTEPGATVALYRYADWTAVPTLEQETVADADGKFAIDSLPLREKETRLWLVVKKPGFASKISYLRSDHKGALGITLKSELASLSGVITDRAGMPVAGAVVTTQSPNHPMAGVHTATTDEKGRFSIDDLSPWDVKETESFDPKTGVGTVMTSHSFWVSHPNYPRTRGEYTSVPQQVELQLDPPAIVEGTVFDLVTGQPMPGVEVQAQGIAEGGWYTTHADDEGKYQLRMIADHYNIWAVAPERMPLAVKALKAAAGQRVTAKDIRMMRGGYVEGRVLDANKQPLDGTLEGLYVAHYGPARPKAGAGVTATPVGADGTFRLHVAPGRNYIYLMGGDSAAYVQVGEGKTVHHDIIQGTTADDAVSMDDDDRLAQRIREQARREKIARRTATPQPDAATLRPDTPVNQLITALDDMNRSNEQFTDIWANQLRTIAAFGEDAVPDLIAELDRTDNDMMLRSTGFLLRAMDDKRAVPALIRAIPKTLRPSGSDMGLRVSGTDESLINFLQQNDLDRKNTDSEYDFGRPVREVFGALEALTGQQFGEEELYNVFLNDDDLPSQKRAKRLLFHRVARQWADWWNQHASEYTDDPAYQSVELPSVPEPAGADFKLTPDTMLESASGSSNWILQSVRQAPGGRVLYDLDTGRAASLPERWRNQELTPELLEQILKWAGEAGYDLMGDEIPSADGEPVYALRDIGLQCWELPENRWKDAPSPTSMAALEQEGRPLDGELLLHYDADQKQLAPKAVATFFFLTSEGTPGILYVGIPVYNTDMKRIERMDGDNELFPIGFHKGRRFGFGRLIVAEDQ